MYTSLGLNELNPEHSSLSTYYRGRLRIWCANTVNTLRPRQNDHYFADDTLKRIFLNETFRFSIKISLTFVPKGPINYIPALVQIMAWRRSGDKPLSEPMMVRLLTHLCVTRPQRVKPSDQVVLRLPVRIFANLALANALSEYSQCSL